MEEIRVHGGAFGCVFCYFCRLESAVSLLQQKLASLPDADLVSIAFPDEGAHKRFHSYFDNDSMVICSKVRDGDKRSVKVKEGLQFLPCSQFSYMLNCYGYSNVNIQICC